MLLPLSVVLQRGVIFLFTKYAKLNDPALSGQTKPKFGIILSTAAEDDPLLYVLATSDKLNKAAAYPHNFYKIAAGSYACFDVDTFIDVSEAGRLDIPQAAFEELYSGTGEVVYKGILTDSDRDGMMKAIFDCPTVDRRYKRILGQ